MGIQTCQENGHKYDDSEHSQCPYCPDKTEVINTQSSDGSANNDKTAGYSEKGSQITFKVYDSSEGELIEMALNEGESVWENNTMTVVSMSDIVKPTEVSLSKAYPNPFNPSTTISYDVPSDMNVSLVVYDVRGRMVAELANGVMNAGTHDVIWNAENQSSGLYFMKLVAGNTMKTQKMMLVK